MNVWEIVRFEVAYQLRRPPTWLYAGVFVAAALLATDGMESGVRRSDALLNAPLTVAVVAVMIGLIGSVVTAALAADAATRDVRARMHPLVYTTPVRPGEYLGGRFLGAVAVNALLLALVPLGLALSAREPVVGADVLGPFRAAPYVRAYAVLLLPTAVATAGVLFAAAAVTRRAAASYGGALVLFLLSVLSEEGVAEGAGRGRLGALLDPYAIAATSEMWDLLTPAQRVVMPVALEGPLLWNRVLWLTVGLAAVGVAVARVRLAHVPEGARRRRRHRADAAGPAAPVLVPRARRAFGVRTRVRQTLAVAGRSLREVAGGHGVAALVGSAAVLVAVGLGTAELADNYGTPFWPTTSHVVQLLSRLPVEAAVVLLATVAAGELVWGERDAGLSPLADAAPVPDGVLFAGKALALGLVVVFFHAVLVGAGGIFQVARGVLDVEPGLYVRALFGLQLPSALLFAALALAVHVVVNEKYVGHLVVVLAYVLATLSGWLSPGRPLVALLLYGSGPGWVHSDFSGFGAFAAPVLWFHAYWAGWALLLAVAARLFWVRGEEPGVARRVRRARRRLTRRTAGVAAAGALVALTVGGSLALRMTVWDEEPTDEEAAALRAEYERRYGRYDGAPQPQVTGTTLHVELYPERREAEVRGTYRLENRTGVAVDTLHLSVSPDVETGPATFSRPARAVLVDDRLGHRAYALDRPLEPGDTLRMTYGVRFRPRGFRGANPSALENGTYFDHTGGRRPTGRRWLPVVGYQADRELADARVRRELGLPPRPDARPLGGAAARRDAAGREWTTFEATVGTAADQVAVAPGRLRETWTEGGRRYVRYATDGPVKNAYAIFSARYDVRRARWEPPTGSPAVQIEVYHHPSHTYNVDRTVRAVRASLDYYTRHFGPYPHRQLRVVEVPRHANFAYAYPGTVSLGEGFGFLARVDSGRHLDTPFLVVAHEVAHQWWGHGVAPADVEGAPVLTEVLAQYSALAVLEETYGPAMARRFLDLARIEYLNRRTGREAPLLRVGEDANVVYRRGALAMHALQGYVGRERVNAALRRLLRKHEGGRPPYPTSLDLYRELRAVTPDSLRPLLADLFEESTVWSLRTVGAHAEPTGRGAWRVTLDVVAQKHRPDGAGTDVEVSMDDPVEVGVYTDGGAPLYLGRHRVRSGRQTITVTVPQAPGRAGVDPRGLLLDRDLGENTVGVRVSPARTPGSASPPPAR